MPIDMTDVQRSIADIGREFQIPLDNSLEDDYPIALSEEGHGVVEFFHNLKCFMSHQHQFLTPLNEERRAHHRETHTTMVKTHLFQPVDVVLCHRQVQSQKSKWISSKLSYAFMGHI
jgi:hypothetical protein